MLVRSRTARALVALAVIGLTAASCGSDDDSRATTTSTPSDDATTTTTTTAASGTATVEVADSDLGQILTSDGRTLYLFMPDNGGAPTCTGDCATTWPPLLADGAPTVGDGLDAALFATANRADGGEQVTVDGWPLYFFSGDAAPGDTNGQDVGGIWYVVDPSGAAIDDDE